MVAVKLRSYRIRTPYGPFFTPF